MKNNFICLLFAAGIMGPLYAQECPPIRPNQRDLAILPDTAGEESIQLLGHHAVNNFQTNMRNPQEAAKLLPLVCIPVDLPARYQIFSYH